MHPVAVTCDTELEEYLDRPCIAEYCNPLEYWKWHQHKYPSLAKLAQHYLNVPATSESVERMFNVGGKFVKPDRCQLNDSSFGS